MVKSKSHNPRLMLDVIKNVINENYIASDQTQMTEKNTGGRKGMISCQINKKQEEVLLCHFDEQGKNPKLFPYFNEVSGFASMSDYVLFAEDSDCLFVFSVELKDSANGPKKQTLRTKSFANFIINRIKAVMGENALPKQIYYRQVGIKTTCCKMTTKAYENLKYDDEDYLPLPDFHHFYTRLLMDL